MDKEQIETLEEAERQLEAAEKLDGIYKTIRISYARGIIHGLLFVLKERNKK